MSYEALLHLTQQAFLLAVMISGPPLLAGLVVGVAVSVVQAVTQVNEVTLGFIPKMAAMLAAIFVSLPWAMAKLVAFTGQIFVLLAQGGR